MNMQDAGAGAPITYDTTRTVTLTLSEFLSLQSALYEAMFSNQNKNFPITAEEIRSLIKAVTDQVGQDLAAAAKDCQERLAASKTRDTRKAREAREAEQEGESF